MQSEQITPTNVSQSTNGSKKRLHNLKNRTAGILILTVGVAVLVSWLIYFRPGEKPRPQIASPSGAYSYDSEEGSQLMATHLLDSGNPGMRLVFKLPLNGVVYTDSPLDRPDSRLIPKDNKISNPIIDQGTSVEFGNRLVLPGGKITFQSVIAAKIVPLDESNFDKYNYFKELLTRLSFNTILNPSNTVFGMSPPAEFTNSNIKNSAQIYKTSAEPPTDSKSSIIKHMNGQLIEIKGKKANYYLLMMAVDKTWDSSPKTWQAIKDSIKIDQ